MLKLLETRRARIILRAALSGAVLVSVFWLGVGVGNGKISWPLRANRPDVARNLPADLNYTSAEEVYDALKASFDGQLNEEQLLDGLKEGLAKASGDPYTEYLNKEGVKEFNEQLDGSFEGIGAELDKDGKNIIVVAPLTGFPAEKAGLMPKDIIAEIDGESAFDIKVTDAIKKIRGSAGTKVKLTIIRDEKVLHFEITREQITIPSVKSEILEGNIGYLKVSRFGEDTKTLSQQAAASFKTANVRGIILDLRNNPGGLLSAAVDVSSLWLSNQIVLQERRGSIVVKTHYASGKAQLAKVPTIVLINDGSASASEIVAGALKDNKVATIMGVTSFGKGSVQELRQLQAGGILKITIARWYTPSGRNIDKDGIEPDKKVEVTDEEVAAKHDSQKEAAISELKQR